MPGNSAAPLSAHTTTESATGYRRGRRLSSRILITELTGGTVSHPVPPADRDEDRPGISRGCQAEVGDQLAEATGILRT